MDMMISTIDVYIQDIAHHALLKQLQIMKQIMAAWLSWNRTGHVSEDC
jgi:hypothetical protein